MAASSMVVMYKCGACGESHELEEDADKCCVCKCGATVAESRRKSFGNQKCARCNCKDRIRHRRDHIRRLEADLKVTREALAEDEALMKATDAKSAWPRAFTNVNTSAR